MEEKRQYPRVAVNTTIDIKDNFRAVIKDVSENGIRMVFDKVLPDEDILLFVPLFNEERICMEAKVIWKKEAVENEVEYGLSIVSISDIDKIKLKRFIDEKLSAGDDFEEKRRCGRADLNIVVNYAIKTNAVTKNINKNGICIITEEMLPEGVIIMLIIFIPEKVSIKAYGKVAWSREVKSGKFESGIEFWEIRRSDREDLEKYIETTSNIGNKV
ncbi:MAG: PilZ domain-containing protein [Spirochaetales bacterium]|nr:PilZ domain-containing protein [Spirochaetales bacterium]